MHRLVASRATPARSAQGSSTKWSTNQTPALTRGCCTNLTRQKLVVSWIQSVPWTQDQFDRMQASHALRRPPTSSRSRARSNSCDADTSPLVCATASRNSRRKTSRSRAPGDSCPAHRHQRGSGSLRDCSRRRPATTSGLKSSPSVLRSDNCSDAVQASWVSLYCFCLWRIASARSQWRRCACGAVRQ
jgi:hypothetical protein